MVRNLTTRHRRHISGFLVNKREKKKYRELGDEVDELLKEE